MAVRRFYLTEAKLGLDDPRKMEKAEQIARKWCDLRHEEARRLGFGWDKPWSQMSEQLRYAKTIEVAEVLHAAGYWDLL